MTWKTHSVSVDRSQNKKDLCIAEAQTTTTYSIAQGGAKCKIMNKYATSQTGNGRILN